MKPGESPAFLVQQRMNAFCQNSLRLYTNKLFHRFTIFKKLYHLRWDIEESYKKDKHSLQLENYSGKTIIAIYQDFYANMLLENLTAILCW